MVYIFGNVEIKHYNSFSLCTSSSSSSSILNRTCIFVAYIWILNNWSRAHNIRACTSKHVYANWNELCVTNFKIAIANSVFENSPNKQLSLYVVRCFSQFEILFSIRKWIKHKCNEVLNYNANEMKWNQIKSVSNERTNEWIDTIHAGCACQCLCILYKCISTHTQIL